MMHKRLSTSVPMNIINNKNFPGLPSTGRTLALKSFPGLTLQAIVIGQREKVNVVINPKQADTSNGFTYKPRTSGTEMKF